MPAALDAQRKSEIVHRLYAVFRDRGYEGSSLAELSQATGLGRSSLYHHFPGGKEQMAEAVLEQVNAFIQTAIADVAASQEPLKLRARRIADAFDRIFGGGRTPCGLGKLAIADLGTRGQKLTRETFALWASAIAKLAADAGMSAVHAQHFAEDWIARLQGSLILHSASGDRKPFERALNTLTLLAEPKAPTARQKTEK